MVKMILTIAAAVLFAVPAHARDRGPTFSGGIWTYAVPAPAGTIIVHRHASRAVHRSRRLARHIRTDPGISKPEPRAVAANGLVEPLAEKVAEIVHSCGSHVISAVRHTYIAGTHRISLHAYGEAADVSGNPDCIYSMLHGWPGGYSIDYGRVRHVHISYEPGGREWGSRFAHGGHRRHYAHHRRHHRWT